MKRTLFAALALGCGASQTPPPEPAPAAVEPAPVVVEVDPIPEGFHTLTPSLVVDDVAAAVTWYTTTLGAEHLYTMDGPDGKAMHAEIKVGDSIVMLSPEDPEHDQKSPKTLKATNGSLHVYVADVDATFKAAVAAGATSMMAVEDMWWGDRFGEVKDPFGHLWSLGTRKEEVPADVMKTRAEAAVAAMKTGKKYTWERAAPATNFKPEGYFTVTPSIVVKGGPEVLDFYKAALDAVVVTSTLAPDGSLLHAELKIGDSMMMMSSEMPPQKGPMAEMAAYAKAPVTLGGAPVQLMVYVPDVDASVTKAIAGGAAMVMEVDDMFWGDRYALATDPSGTPFGIATHIEDVPPEAMKERMMKQMAEMGAEGAPPAPTEATPPPQP